MKLGSKFKARRKRLHWRTDQGQEVGGLPTTSWGGVVPSPTTLIVGMELPAPVLAGSPSTRVGSSVGALAGDLSLGGVGSPVEALAGDPSLGGIVDGGGMSGVALSGSSYFLSSPANPTRLAVKIHTPTLASRK